MRTSSAHTIKLVALFQGFRMYNPNYAVCGVQNGRGKVRQGAEAAHFRCDGEEAAA